MDKSNDLKQIREQIRKLDEQLDTDMQVRLFLYKKNETFVLDMQCLMIRYASVEVGPRGAGLGSRDGVCREPPQASREESQ